MLSKKKRYLDSNFIMCSSILYSIYDLSLGILFKNAVIENNGDFTFAYFAKFLS